MGEHILVGVDGSPACLAAVELASYEARLRGRPLLLINVGGPVQSLPLALERAAAVEPEVKVTGEVLTGDPATRLIEASGDALLLIVGHRGADGFQELLLGSVAGKLAAHARCPVMVARGRAGGDDVVVGVDGSAAADPAIGFAFAEADLRHAPVLALHAATGPQFSGPSDALVYDWCAEEARAVGLLYHAVAEWHERHPDLLVQRRVRWAAPGESLLKASRSAQLVVVGRRGRGGFLGLRLGSVGQALLHHAACPVAVVPDVS
jgi:nucleotide-binding universal stress UspA family protein